MEKEKGRQGERGKKMEDRGSKIDDGKAF